MSIDDARAAGRRLAERHRAAPADPAPDGSLVNFSEAPHAEDWTLRSAMTRLAQPEPELVVAIATLMRRLEAVLHHVARPLEKTTVSCDKALTIDNLSADPVAPYPDTRTADLARLVASAPADADAVIDGYADVEPLTEAEAAALPLLGVALLFDALAEALVEWARVAPAPAPVDLVHSTCAEIQTSLDALGVPVEEGPPPRGARRRG